jgi:glycerophosphoryl diester phosphodiesterase
MGLRRTWLAACALFAAACNPATTANNAAETAGLAPRDLPAFFDCLRASGQTIVAAHRGGPSPGYAENAIETFAHTTAQAPAALEIDIARTRDDVLVLMHDDTVDRTTNGSGDVREMTLASFQALSLKDENGAVLNAHPPTLREALDWAEDRTILELDVKRGVSYEDVIAEVRAAGAESRVIFITYSADAAVRVHRLAPELMISVNVASEDDLSSLVSRGVDTTKLLAWTGVDEPNAALNVALAARGIEVLFGTLGRSDESWDGRFEREGDQYAAFAETGIQLIATDRPLAAVQDLDAHDGVDGVGAMECAAP